MKLLEIYNLIAEGIIVFHGTDAQFDEFDTEKIGSSDKRELGGWGIYFSDDPQVSKQYITQKGQIKKYEIRNGNFLDLDDTLSSGAGEIILNGIKQLDDVSEDDIEQFESDYVGYEYDTTNMQSYEWLSYVLGSSKNASLFLKKLGYDGNIFKDKTIPDATNYVIYNTRIIKNT